MSKMLTGSRDCSSRFLQDDRFFSRLLSREPRYNPGKLQREASFRVLYYGGAGGSVPFLWESTPGTPKHPSAHSPTAAPLTPPPSYQSPCSNPKSSWRHSGKNSRIFRSMVPSSSSKKMKALSSLSLSSSASASSTSSFSSGYSAAAAAHDGRVRSGAVSPTSTLCFIIRPRSCGNRLKKAVRAIVGR